MNKLDLARRLARELHRSRAEAADDVDNLVYRILKDLKQAELQSQNRKSEGCAGQKEKSSKGKP
jgi:hypothetical protein